MVLDSKIFPGFRQAFEPAQISWDIDPAPLKQRAVDIEKGKIKSILCWYLVTAGFACPGISRKII